MPGLVDIDASINDMMEAIAKLTPQESGQWLRYTGKQIDWWKYRMMTSFVSASADSPT